MTLRLADEIDVTRGDLVAAVSGAPEPSQDLTGLVTWLAERPLHLGARVLVKHGTRTVQGVVREISGRLDLDTLVPVPSEVLELNDIGRVTLRLAAPVMPDDYAVSRRTGSFLLIDPQTGGTLAAGMVRAASEFDEAARAAATLHWVI